MNSAESVIERRLLNGETVLHHTVGTSMEPLIRQGVNHVAIKSVALGKPRIGDIVLVRTTAGFFLLHRLIWLRREMAYTRGDNRSGGEWVRREDIIGVLSAIYGPGHSCRSARSASMIARGLEKVAATLLAAAWRKISR